MERFTKIFNYLKQVLSQPEELLVRLGFCAVIVLIAMAAWLMDEYKHTPSQELGQKLAAVETEDKDIGAIRRQISAAVVSVREFLINNHPNASEVYAQELRKEKSSLAPFIAELRKSATPTAVQPFEKDLADFWTAVEKSISFKPRYKVKNGFDYLREEVFPARSTALDSLKELANENTKEREAIFAGYDQSRGSVLRWFYVVLGACVFFTLLLTWASLSYRSHLQRESLTKFDEVARARDDLEHLSGKLLKVQEEERRRLSRELHDGIGQTLTALRMEIHYAHLNAANGAQAGERLMRARMLAEEAVHTVKDISLLLRPPLLDDLGLEPAIAWQADQFTRRTGIPCRFRATGLQEMLPDDVKTCVFRVIQEALNNCQKHASPTKVQILIDQRREALSVHVEDDGAGFVVKGGHFPVRHSGLGVLGMRERASMLGGVISIQSSPGMGTRLTLTLPLATMTPSAAPRVEPPSAVTAVAPAAERRAG